MMRPLSSVCPGSLQEYAKLEVNKLLMHGTTIQFQVNQTLYTVLTSPFFLVHILKLLFPLFSYYTAFLNINDAFNRVHRYNLCTMYFIFLCMYISVMKETSPCTKEFQVLTATLCWDSHLLSVNTFTSIPFASTCMLVNCFQTTHVLILHTYFQEREFLMSS